jgi:CheY-like chemotaxis protein
MSLQNQDLTDMKILLVEDSFEALNLARNMLKDLGVTQVFTAKDGMEALDMLNAFDGEDFVDAIICDWNMPQLTGLDLLKQIRTCDPDLPFLMMTGIADLESVTEAKAFGVTGYIKKPFSSDQLKKKLGIISRIIAHRG